jgi:hypothetical protein
MLHKFGGKQRMPVAISRDHSSPRCRTSQRIGSTDRTAQLNRPDPTARPDQCAIRRLNQRLSGLQIPLDLTEPAIEDILQQLERLGEGSLPQHQLLTARILEAALLCAGHYVDNCEFTAAGDLLVNPRQILIHQKGESHPTIKMRHGRLSDQLGHGCQGRGAFLDWFKCNVVLEIAKPALLPGLLRHLERYGSFQNAYLDSIRLRMNQAAQTIAFLSAWHVSDPADRHTRIHTASAQKPSFIEENLCRFDTKDFHRLGLEIERCSCRGGFKSHYLTSFAGQSALPSTPQ